MLFLLGANERSGAKQVSDTDPDPDADAKAAHAANHRLNWLRWEQLSEASRDEYRRDSRKEQDHD